eukprot:2858311-Amphidinium_carterae.1
MCAQNGGVDPLRTWYQSDSDQTSSDIEAPVAPAHPVEAVHSSESADEEPAAPMHVEADPAVDRRRRARTHSAPAEAAPALAEPLGRTKDRSRSRPTPVRVDASAIRR